MQDDKNLSKVDIQEQQIVQNSALTIWEALIPVFALVGMLAYNVFIFGDDALSGTNQFILLIGGAVAAIVGLRHRVSFKSMMTEVAENVKSTSNAIFILLMVGALAGTWLLSGVIPTMIYYGLKLLNRSIFLPACLVISAVISIATGSSWTTAATVGIALIGIGAALGVSMGLTAGAVLSGAYFGDKMSPLSDTTNLAPAMAGTDLITHIKYMTLTTIPSIVITLIIFLVIGLVAAFIVTRIPMRVWQKISGYLMLLCLFLLVVVLIPGIGRVVNGSRRWIYLGITSVQVSEIVKLFIIVVPIALFPKLVRLFTELVFIIVF